VDFWNSLSKDLEILFLRNMLPIEVLRQKTGSVDAARNLLKFKSYFHKHTNKQYTVFQNAKLLLFNTLLVLTILFTLFSWKDKTEITIKTANKNGIYLLKFEIESISIYRKRRIFTNTQKNTKI